MSWAVQISYLASGWWRMKVTENKIKQPLRQSDFSFISSHLFNACWSTQKLISVMVYRLFHSSSVWVAGAQTKTFSLKNDSVKCLSQENNLSFAAHISPYTGCLGSDSPHPLLDNSDENQRLLCYRPHSWWTTGFSNRLTCPTSLPFSIWWYVVVWSTVGQENCNPQTEGAASKRQQVFKSTS